MEFKKLMTAAALMSAMMVGASAANATTTAQGLFNARYLTDDTACTTCHASSTVTKANAVGTAWLGAGGRKDAAPTDWAAFETAAGSTFGGVDPAWTAPVASSGGGGGCITDAATTPLMMLVAMLTLGFFVSRKKD